MFSELTCFKIKYAAGSVESHAVLIHMIRQYRHMVLRLRQHSLLTFIRAACFDLLFKCLLHIGALIGVGLSVDLHLGFHSLDGAIRHTLDRAFIIHAPLLTVVVIPLLLGIAISDVLAKQINKTFGVAHIVKAVKLDSLSFFGLTIGYTQTVVITGRRLIYLGAVCYRLLYRQSAVGSTRLLAIPLIAHQPRLSEQRVDLLGVRARPKGEHIAQSHISLTVRTVS